jgi:Tfp pilus assembly protein PilX
MKVSVMNKKGQEYGAISLFIVIFTTLLVTVITISFVRIMLSDQRQATAADLSQSAYDSAQAGVEDAKRALLYYQSECAKSGAKCADALTLIGSTVCNAALTHVVGDVSGQEVLVKKDDTDNALQQAYTCVKINLQTDDYIGVLDQDESKLIPLVGTEPFDEIYLEWFSSKDLQGQNTKADIPVFSAEAPPPLLSQSDWTSAATPNRPPIMRAQLMQFSSDEGFVLSDFDGNESAAGKSNTNTLFLYPSTVIDTEKFFVSNTRKVATSPTQISCNPDLGSGGYACSVSIKLPEPINGGGRTAYLRLSALYKKTNYRLTLLKSGIKVNFNGVQPEIDSTGRANDLFRRVRSRVELGNAAFPYPDAAVDITGDFCKDFLITDKTTNYSSSCVVP